MLLLPTTALGGGWVHAIRMEWARAARPRLAGTVKQAGEQAGPGQSRGVSVSLVEDK